jgi:hypothetical protein
MALLAEASNRTSFLDNRSLPVDHVELESTNC